MIFRSTAVTDVQEYLCAVSQSYANIFFGFYFGSKLVVCGEHAAALIENSLTNEFRLNMQRDT